jgi:hypothetical protein
MQLLERVDSTRMQGVEGVQIDLHAKAEPYWSFFAAHHLDETSNDLIKNR